MVHQLTEVDKCVLLAIGSGAIGGLIQAIIQDIVSQIKNSSTTNFIKRLKLYLSSCLTNSILLGLFIFFGVMFDTSASIANSGQFIVISGIIIFPLITLSTEILETFVFKKQDN